MSYDLHASLAKKFDGAKHWGYRTVETLSIEYDATRPSKAGSSKPVLTWLSNDHIHTSRQLGTHETTAQVHPGQFTTFIVDRFKEQRDTDVIIGRAHGLDVQNGTVKGVKVGGRTVPADVVVICAGPWTGALAVELLGKSVGGRLGVTGHRAHSVIFKTKETLTPHCLFTNMTMREGRVDEPEVYCRPDGASPLVYLTKRGADSRHCLLVCPEIRMRSRVRKSELIRSCGAGDDEPLPPTAADVRPSPANIAKLYAQAAELTPHFTKDPQYAEVVAEQACYLPIADRGKPLIGTVPGIEGVYVGSG